MTSTAKANPAVIGEIPSVNGQTNVHHADGPEKDLETEALEAALENGPKGMTKDPCTHTKMFVISCM